jgi:hypothetical protein
MLIPGKKMFQNGVPGYVPLRKNFLNDVPARSITIIPLLLVILEVLEFPFRRAYFCV